MRKKSGLIFLGIVFFFVLAVILLFFQSCKKDHPGTDTQDFQRISSPELYPSWSPDGQKIAFSSNRDGNFEIYTMNADGSDQTRLTNEPFRDTETAWSPDSTKIAFQSNRDGNWEIYTMNTDGSNQMRLTDDPSADEDPSWSPDGTRIAFQSNRDGNWEIYTMKVDGTDQMRLTDNPVRDAEPSWSHDSKRILFSSARDENLEIYMMNDDGSDQTRLTDTPAQETTPSWSPDGTRIAFHSNREGSSEIYIMDVDGSNPRRLKGKSASHSSPSWSPDSQKIAFTTFRDFDNEIYVINADGSNPVNLTKTAPDNKAVGSAPLPRSELELDDIPYKIVYESFRKTDGKENWEICQIDADGSNFVNLTNTPEIHEMYPHASPDGRRICFMADEGEDLESRSKNIYYMNKDGTDRVKIAENAYQSCWSPDGKQIAYLPSEFPRYNPNDRANKGLEIYDLETGKTKRHPNEELMELGGLCWSPDGNWFIARSGWLSAFKADDNTKIILSAPGCTPDISPDGKQLAWNLTDWNLNAGKLALDSSQRNVTEHCVVVICKRDHWVFSADWSPDGNYLTFAYGTTEGSPRGGRPAPGCNICICDLKTGKWTLVTTDGKHNKQPDWVVVQEQ